MRSDSKEFEWLANDIWNTISINDIWDKGVVNYLGGCLRQWLKTIEIIWRLEPLMH